MQRIDTSTAVSSIPATSTPGTPGYFTNGNPASSTPATVLDADWANMVQEELMAVVLAAGLSPSKTTRNQVLQGLPAALASRPEMANSKTANGYFKLPGGIIVQWGNATTNASGRATVAFPIAFPTAALWAMSGVAATALSNYAVANGPPSATALELYSTVGGSTTAASLSAWWIAIGH